MKIDGRSRWGEKQREREREREKRKREMVRENVYR